MKYPRPKAYTYRRFSNVEQAIGRLEDEIAELERKVEQYKIQLAQERPNLATFLAKVDLTSYPGRSRANALLKRRKIAVYMEKSCYMVDEDGEVTFVVAYLEGAVAATTFEEVGPYRPEYATQIEAVINRMKAQQEKGGFRAVRFDRSYGQADSSG